MSQEKVRFKIVNKAKDGVTLSARKGTNPEKIAWDEFNKYYTIEDKVWAVPSDELLEKMNEVNEHISDATVSFILSGGLKEGGPSFNSNNMTHILVMQKHIDKICELLNCSMLEAIQLVRKNLDLIRGDFSSKSKYSSADRRKMRQENARSAYPHLNDVKAIRKESEVGHSTSAVMEDNPALIALKEKMSNNA